MTDRIFRCRHYKRPITIKNRETREIQNIARRYSFNASVDEEYGTIYLQDQERALTIDEMIQLLADLKQAIGNAKIVVGDEELIIEVTKEK